MQPKNYTLHRSTELKYRVFHLRVVSMSSSAGILIGRCYGSTGPPVDYDSPRPAVDIPSTQKHSNRRSRDTITQYKKWNLPQFYIEFLMLLERPMLNANQRYPVTAGVMHVSACACRAESRAKAVPWCVQMEAPYQLHICLLMHELQMTVLLSNHYTQK